MAGETEDLNIISETQTTVGRSLISLLIFLVLRIDAIVFTGGIGEKSFIKRKRILGKYDMIAADYIYSWFLEYLAPFGVHLDEDLNNENGKDSTGPLHIKLSYGLLFHNFEFHFTLNCNSNSQEHEGPF